MSHFTCLVIGDNVEEQLEPFYELECTMDQNEIKNDPRAEFVKSFTTDELEKDFFRVKNESPELYYESLEEFAEDYHGYIKCDTEEKWGRWTNPKAQWDWYSIGGRWPGFFKIKENPKYPDNICLGEPGLMTKKARSGYADSIRICDIDFEGMKKDKFNELKETWSKVQNNIEKEDKSVYWMHGITPEDTEETYIERYSNFSTYAVIKDGEWYAKGEMGWFGMSSDENENWKENFTKLIESLPEDSLLTLVDCHI